MELELCCNDSNYFEFTIVTRKSNKQFPSMSNGYNNTNRIASCKRNMVLARRKCHRYVNIIRIGSHIHRQYFRNLLHQSKKFFWLLESK